VLAVDGLNLSIAEREFVVVVGPCGCGKTTILRLIAGLEEPTSGTIRIAGADVAAVPPRDRDVAMVFQSYALYPHMTVFKNMAFGLRMRGVPRRETQRLVDETAGMLGITHLLERRPATLSSGERQRVALGRAVVRKPRVFLLDEPLSNLDAQLRTHMRTELKTLHRRLQTTIIHVTHDQEEAMTLGDRIAVLKDGVVQQFGRPLDLYNSPANRFVASFIGTPSMNFLTGRLAREQRQSCFTCGLGRLVLPADFASRARAYHGRDVILGIRSEHVRVADGRNETSSRKPKGRSPESSQPRTTHAAATNVTVQTVEPLGDCIRVHVQTGTGEPIVARAAPNAALLPGYVVDITFDLSHAHIFEPGETGERLA
ncbi:MAG: ABC transporter ATP-binding protein, partial [Phycisphaerae bacterium]